VTQGLRFEMATATRSALRASSTPMPTRSTMNSSPQPTSRPRRSQPARIRLSAYRRSSPRRAPSPPGADRRS
jgi:hypothetical protein